MALLVDSEQKCKNMSKLAKYVVFFFYDSSKMEAATFRKEFTPLLKEVRTNKGFKCAQFDQKKVGIPKARFGFASDKGVIFYRSGEFLTYMCDFEPGKFKRITTNIDTEKPVHVPGTKSVVEDKKPEPKVEATKAKPKVEATNAKPKVEVTFTASIRSKPPKPKPKPKPKKVNLGPRKKTVRFLGVESTFSLSRNKE